MSSLFCLQDTIEAFLSVIDINDNAPIFTKSVDTAYYKVISEVSIIQLLPLCAGNIIACSPEGNITW